MSYTIQNIIPYNLTGTFKREGTDYFFQFIHPIPNMGHLHVYGTAGAATVENLYVLSSLVNRNFSPVYEKINQIYSNHEGVNTTLIQYQVLITGFKQPNGDTLNQTRFINVYFTNSFKKVVLNDGKEVEIKENNINDFLNNINTYELE